VNTLCLFPTPISTEDGLLSFSLLEEEVAGAILLLPVPDPVLDLITNRHAQKTIIARTTNADPIPMMSHTHQAMSSPFGGERGGEGGGVEGEGERSSSGGEEGGSPDPTSGGGEGG
jgi:hypothetical protein